MAKVKNINDGKKKPGRRTAKQVEIPGTERTTHADIEDAADKFVASVEEFKEYKEARDLRHRGLLAAMKKHGLELYKLPDHRIVRVKDGEAKVKVEKPKKERRLFGRRGGF